MRRVLSLFAAAAVAATACQAQLLKKPRIGVKLGISFSDTYNATGTDTNLDVWWTLGGDIEVPGAGLWNAKSRADVDLLYGPGHSSQFRVGISQVWYGLPGIEVTPYGGVSAGVLFEDKRFEADRSVLSLKAFGGMELGHNLFIEVAVLQSSRTDAVFLDVGMRF
jgi:hypothetical protein